MSRSLFAAGCAIVVAAGVSTLLLAFPADRSAAPAGRPAVEPASLAAALRVSAPLGPVPARTPIHLVLSLRSTHQKELERLFRSGRGFVGGDAASLLRPPAALVERALAAARRAGFAATWKRGDTIASLVGPSRDLSKLVGVHLRRYRLPDGRRFFAADRAPVLPAALRPVVTGIAGLDDYANPRPPTVTPGGAGAPDTVAFYDIGPLHARGLEGQGETVAIPDEINPKDFAKLRSDVEKYSSEYHLPPPDMSMRADRSFGPFATGGVAKEWLGEADLDFEVVHAIAPRAKLVLYVEGDFSAGAGYLAAEDAAVKDNPKGIVSLSIEGCEAEYGRDKQLQAASERPWLDLAAVNGTAFVATGDEGAFECGQKYGPAVSFPASIPVVVSVGGTMVFDRRGGGYGAEAAWGMALSGSGGGGGASRMYARPPWQKGVGPPLASAPGRLVPDVSSNADYLSTVTYGKIEPTFGTSAAAPFWSGLAALIDQDLARHGLRRMGVPLAALAWIAAHQSTYHAFHDVARGNNLFYKATPGWDEATGWGSPDGANLDAAFLAYMKSKGS